MPLDVCEHGGLRRKCEVCELRDRVEELEEALREAAESLDRSGNLAISARLALLSGGSREEPRPDTGEPCNACGATGGHPDVPCPSCGGSGRRDTNKET